MNAILWNIYRHALRFLPHAFRHHYAEQMIQTAHESAADHPLQLVYAFSLFQDLAATTLRENIRMFAKLVSRRPFFYQALCLGAIAFFLALGGYVVMQQTIRRAANQPQQQMAEDAVRLYSITAPLPITTPRIDLAHSLEPFTIVYDENGKVISSEAAINGIAPTPPPGVFANARKWGANELTWQPRRDVRLAMVLRHFSGVHQSGFVLVGRSLTTAEQGEQIARWAALLGWLGIVCLLTVSAAIFSRVQRRQRATGA